jgi:S-DNA-T family DNA segregation ATPase FtsK/SpoIIIE
MVSLAQRSPPGGRSLASPAVRQIIGRRLGELGALGLGLGGIVLLLALASYDAADPSFNTATAHETANLVGPTGAIVADVLLQMFGLAGALPGVVMLGWAWRFAARRGIDRFGLRVCGLLMAMPVLAATLAGLNIPGPHGGPLPWPVQAGLGGAAGQEIGHAVIGLAHDLLGPTGAVLMAVFGLVLSTGLTWVGSGVSVSDVRAARAGAAGAARHSFSGGRRAAGLFTRWGERTARWIRPLLGRPIGAVERNEGHPERSYAPPPTPMREEPTLGDPQGPRLRSQPQADPPPAPLPGTPAAPRLQEPPPPPQHPPQAGNPTATTHAINSAPLIKQPTPPVMRNRLTAAIGRALPEPGWRFPSLSLLAPPPPRATTGPSQDVLQGNARMLETVLADYGVQGVIKDIRPGPVVTLYELEPAPGIRSARVIGLADDIARSLSVTAVRIATVPGRNVIGIELPNPKRETVFLAELLGSEEWHKQPGRLTIALGKDISGAAQIADLARMPHLLVAGTTGSGKSVGINAFILSLLYRLSPEHCRMILIDPKMLELSVYEGIPHLMAPVVTEPAKAVVALKWTVREMERRYRAMSQLSVRNIGGYNDRVAEARARGEVVTRRVQTGFDSETGRPTFEEQPLALEALPFIVVVIDEMADLMMVAGKEIEAAVQRLAQMARAAGIHVVMATQRPSVDVITGTIKANFPTRISFTVISKFDSRTILGEQGAEQLLGQGDMLYMAGGGRITRVHGPFVSDREVEDVVAFLRTQGEPAYVDEVTQPADEVEASPLSGIAGASDGEKGLFDQAVALVAREGKASTSFIQRHLQIGYNRAAKLIEQMEKEGIISPANHVGKREILVRRTDPDD